MNKPMAKYVRIEEVVRIVESIKAMYPTDLFPHPEGATGSGPQFFAAGARLACDNMLADLANKQGGEQEK